MAEAIITIIARDYAEEEAERIAAEEETARSSAAAQKAAEAALQAELTKAASLSCPALKVKALKGKKIRITWGKVENADG